MGTEDWVYLKVGEIDVKGCRGDRSKRRVELSWNGKSWDPEQEQQSGEDDELSFPIAEEAEHADYQPRGYGDALREGSGAFGCPPQCEEPEDAVGLHDCAFDPAPIVGEADEKCERR